MLKGASILTLTLSSFLVSCSSNIINKSPNSNILNKDLNNKLNNNTDQKNNKIDQNQSNTTQKQDNNNDTKINNFIKITKELNNQFQVLNSSYKINSLISSVSFENKQIDLTKHQDIDYVDLEQYVDLLKDILNQTIYNDNLYSLTQLLETKTNNNQITISLTNKYQANDKNKHKDFSLTEFIKFDYLTQQITISNVNFYNLLNPYQNESNLEYFDHFKLLEKKPLIINLNKYDIFIFNKENKLYLPLLVLNQIFLAESEKQIFFNNNKILVFEIFDLFSTTNNETKKVLVSNKKNLKISNHLKQFQYNYLYFLLDNFYPIKLDKSYQTYLEKYKNGLLSDDLKHFKTTNLLIRGLNDIHTKILLQSPIYDLNTNDSELEINNDKQRTDRVAKFRKYERDISKLASDLHEKDIRYTNDNKTAIIKIDIFHKWYTVDAVKKQLEEIKNNKTVKNVVFDLSLNRGGSIVAVYQILGYLTDQKYNYHKLYPTTNDKQILQIQSKVGRFDFNYYILSSPINYSAGNSFAAISKTNKLAKIIGFNSGGGASEVRISILPTGSIIRKSSIYTLTDQKWNSYEYEVKPDIEFDKTNDYDFKKLFDLDYIQTVINNDQNK